MVFVAAQGNHSSQQSKEILLSASPPPQGSQRLPPFKSQADKQVEGFPIFMASAKGSQNLAGVTL